MDEQKLDQAQQKRFDWKIFEMLQSQERKGIFVVLQLTQQPSERLEIKNGVIVTVWLITMVIPDRTTVVSQFFQMWVPRQVHRN